MLYRGASFDVVNPHPFLLLDVYNFETPAEIDGLLDDYFDESNTDNMPYDPVTGNMSQNSLGTPIESSRRSRKLYDDMDLARRSIMRSYDELPTPPPAYLHNSPLGYRSYTSMSTPPDSVHEFPAVSVVTSHTHNVSHVVADMDDFRSTPARLSNCVNSSGTRTLSRIFTLQ